MKKPRPLKNGGGGLMRNELGKGVGQLGVLGDRLTVCDSAFQVGVDSVFSHFPGFFDCLAKSVEFWNRRHDHVEVTAGLGFKKYGVLIIVE